MEFNEVLALRKSVRRYTKEIVSQEDEKAILDAAMASSVGKHNDGGYNLVVVRDREILDLIAKEEKEETAHKIEKFVTDERRGSAFWRAPAVSDLPHEGSGGLSHAV